MNAWRRALAPIGAGLACATLATLGTGALCGQIAPTFPPTYAASGLPGPSAPFELPAPPQTPSEPAAWRPPAASLVLPGSGQWMLDQRRSVAYLAIDGLAVALHFERKGRGRSLRTEYRDLAWTVARAGTAAPRMDGDFDYYERLSFFRSSGRLDADPAAPGIQPEQNTATYNGRIWQLARGLFLGGNPQPQPGDPGWDQAVSYYTERGYGDRFFWDWAGRDAELRAYRETLDRSDAAFRRATTLLGVVMANHLVSAIDALMSSSGGLASALRVRAVPAALPTAGGPVWDLELRVRR